MINQRRLRDYPRLMLVTAWAILAINLLLHQGWQGLLGQIIGSDFIMFYSTGLIYRSHPNLIYDYDEQLRVQQSLIHPTVLPGLNPFMNPPYVAPLYSMLTSLPLSWAISLWTCLMLLCVVVAVRWMAGFIPPGVRSSGLNFGQLLIIVLSFFPLIEGLQAGQNHGLTLLLVTALIFFTFSGRGYLAGVAAGLLLYKPQFVLGFLIIWVVWRQYKALAGFCGVALIWIGSFFISHGYQLFQDFQQLSQVFLLLPYIEGFPRYILVTIYGLLTSILPQSFQPAIAWISNGLFILAAGGLAYLAYRLRHQPMERRIPALALALLYPLIATPYTLLHDLLILIPGFVLWARYDSSHRLMHTAIIIYLGAFFLTLAAALTKIALVSMLVICLAVAVIIWLFRHRTFVFNPQELSE